MWIGGERSCDCWPARVAHVHDRDVRGSQVGDVQDLAVLREPRGNRVITDAQPRHRASTAGVENVELLVGVVQRVEERTIGRRAQPPDRRLILLRSVERVADARFLPSAVVPQVKDLNVARFIAGAIRHVDPIALRRERETTPGLLHLERGDFLLTREIDEVKRVMRVASIGEGEELAVGAHLPTEDHVSRRELPACWSGLPPTHEQRVRTVWTRDRYLFPGYRMLDAERVERGPGGTCQNDDGQSQGQAFHRVLLSVPEEGSSGR